MVSIRSKFLEVHNDCVKKTQEYDAMYGEHTRISQVITTPFIAFVCEYNYFLVMVRVFLYPLI